MRGALGPIKNRKTALTKNYPKPKDRYRFRSKPKTAYKTIKTRRFTQLNSVHKTLVQISNVGDMWTSSFQMLIYIIIVSALSMDAMVVKQAYLSQEPPGEFSKDPRLNSNRGLWGKFCVRKKLSRCKPPLKIQNPTLRFDLD